MGPDAAPDRSPFGKCQAGYHGSLVTKVSRQIDDDSVIVILG